MYILFLVGVFSCKRLDPNADMETTVLEGLTKIMKDYVIKGTCKKVDYNVMISCLHKMLGSHSAICSLTVTLNYRK